MPKPQFAPLFGAALIFVTLLAACGGEGGGGSPTIPNPGGGSTPTPSATATPTGAPAVTPTPTAVPTATPVPTPTPTPGGAMANVTGTVVDEAANTPLANVKVSLAAYTHGAMATLEGTTNSSGVVNFSVAPGTYWLVVGSDNASDSVATLHEQVTLVAGGNTLTAQAATSEPNVTPTTSQTNGALRLMALSSSQQNCLSGANSGRAANSLPLEIPDEYLEEDAQAAFQEEVAQSTDTPTPMFSNMEIYGHNAAAWTTSSGFNPCSSWTDTYSFTNGTPPFPYATNASNIYYGGILGTTAPGWGAQIWGYDPR